MKPSKINRFSDPAILNLIASRGLLGYYFPIMDGCYFPIPDECQQAIGFFMR
jgi:hypothetical protein